MPGLPPMEMSKYTRGLVAAIFIYNGSQRLENSNNTHADARRREMSTQINTKKKWREQGSFPNTTLLMHQVLRLTCIPLSLFLSAGCAPLCYCQAQPMPWCKFCVVLHKQHAPTHYTSLHTRTQTLQWSLGTLWATTSAVAVISTMSLTWRTLLLSLWARERIWSVCKKVCFAHLRVCRRVFVV